MRPAILAAITAMFLAGCSAVSDPAPVDRFYRISVPEPAASGTVSLPGTVLVGRLDAEGLMRERPVVYSEDDDALTLVQHEYDFWIEPPTRLLQAQLVQYLRSAEIAGSVVTPELRVRSDFEVVGTVRRFERLIGRSGPKVAVTLDLALIDRGGDTLRVVDTYAVEIDCPDSSIDASVTAFNEALHSIFKSFLDDIRRSGPSSA